MQANQKEIDVENNNSQLEKLKDELSALLKNCEELYSVYDEKRNNVSIIYYFIIYYVIHFLFLKTGPERS